MTREQLQQIRDALLNIKSYGDVYRYKAHEVNPYVQLLEAIAILDAALAAPEQKPFCYHDGVNVVDPEFANDCDVFPLYTHLMPEPAAQHARDAVAWTPDTGYVFAPDKKAAPVAALRREWVGLTDEEISRIHRVYCASWDAQYFTHVTHAIEAALKEKNHG